MAIDIEVTADSIEEARLLTKTQTPDGLEVRWEYILCDGEPRTSRGVADTGDAALRDAHNQVPSGADIIETAHVAAASDEVVTIEAFDVDSAKHQAAWGKDETASVRDVVLVTRGRGGILGIGKTPNRYDVLIRQRAVVVITYKSRVTVRTTVGVKAATFDKDCFQRGVMATSLLVAPDGRHMLLEPTSLIYREALEVILAEALNAGRWNSLEMANWATPGLPGQMVSSLQFVDLGEPVALVTFATGGDAAIHGLPKSPRISVKEAKDHILASIVTCLPSSESEMWRTLRELRELKGRRSFSRGRPPT